jgi:hypothetical protein
MPVIMVERGSCDFVTKVANIEKLGAKFAVVVDNIAYENIDLIVMADDGRGKDLHIPAFLIS